MNFSNVLVWNTGMPKIILFVLEIHLCKYLRILTILPKQFKTTFKLFVLEFAFTFACLAFGRQALTLLNR
ncbi:MAG: hypothetical protein LBP59_18485 [Planctomycetaceae bacterium]|nr:hypothetical protein [Planctomycetaceae bacterium]